MVSDARVKIVIFAVVMTLMLLAGCATLRNGDDGFVRDAQPPLPLETADLKPGLAVLFFDKTFVRHLDSLPKGERARERGRPGAPIPYLNFQFGRGMIFDSGTNRGLGMEISGYIRLDQPGTYAFQANSNDGFRLFIDGQQLIDDPNWHSDRLSPVARIAVSNPGWYSLRIRYFQRKGTATIQLYWQPPGKEALTIIPPKALAHQQPY